MRVPWSVGKDCRDAVGGVAMFVCVAVWAVPTPLSAQQTPRERADSLQGLASAPATPDEERPRLFMLSLAAWYEEGARARLDDDRDRLQYAAEQEATVLPLAYFWLGHTCPEASVSMPPLSALAVVLGAGHWESGEVPSYVYGLASTLLEEADRRLELSGRLCDVGRNW